MHLPLFEETEGRIGLGQRELRPFRSDADLGGKGEELDRILPGHVGDGPIDSILPTTSCPGMIGNRGGVSLPSISSSSV